MLKKRYVFRSRIWISTQVVLNSDLISNDKRLCIEWVWPIFPGESAARWRIGDNVVLRIFWVIPCARRVYLSWENNRRVAHFSLSRISNLRMFNAAFLRSRRTLDWGCTAGRSMLVSHGVDGAEPTGAHE